MPLFRLFGEQTSHVDIVSVVAVVDVVAVEAVDVVKVDVDVDVDPTRANKGRSTLFK